MMSVSNDSGNVFYGNYWDCVSDPKTLADFLKSLGLEDIYLDKDLPSIG